jgi:hypothetical protein
MTIPQPKCIVCEETNQTIPLIELTYREEKYWICPAHLPDLIHSPAKLVGKIPGAEHLKAHDHEG